MQFHCITKSLLAPASGQPGSGLGVRVSEGIRPHTVQNSVSRR